MSFPTLDLSAARRQLERLHPNAPILALALDGTAPPVVAVTGFFRDAAILLFPAWLPEAEGIEHAGGSGLAALRHLAKKASRGAMGINPVLEPLAIEALTGQRSGMTGLADETVVRACAQLIEGSYRASPLTVLLAVPDDRDANAVGHAVSWLAGLSIAHVYLCGPGAHGIAHTIELKPDDVRIEGQTVSARSSELESRYISPITGRPSPNSPTEQRMERFLAEAAWAAGRRWQAPWQPDALTTPIRVDLMFPDARLVVEFDGLEHLGPGAYASDRRRDRRLMAAGYRVIRFTNAEVATDLSRVADEIRAFVEGQED